MADSNSQEGMCIGVSSECHSSSMTDKREMHVGLVEIVLRNLDSGVKATWL